MPQTMARIGRRILKMAGNGLTRPVVLLVLACLLISGLFNIYIFNPGEPASVSIFSLLSSSLLLATLLLVFLKVRFIGWIFLPVIILVCFTAYYIKSSFGLFVSYEVIASILETDPSEASAYVTGRNILMISVLFAAITAFLHFGRKHLAAAVKLDSIILVSALCCLSFIPATLSVNRLDDTLANYPYFRNSRFWPLVDVRTNYKRIKEYYKKGGRQYHEIMHLPSLAQQPSDCSLTGEDEMIIVLHIGESVRGDHLHFNGYHRNTTPMLDCLGDNLIPFPDHYSFGLVTRVSIVGILTDADSSDRTPNHRSFIDLFNKHGFETAAVMTLPTTIHEFPLKILTSACKYQEIIAESNADQQRVFTSSVKNFGDALGRMEGRRQFLVLYDTGAHPFFQSFDCNERFQPDHFDVEAPLSSIENVINAYDNNLLEIDWEVSSIIKTLEDKVAVYFFVGDHGIALGEHNMFGQGNTAPPVMKPAMFIWLSDRFIERYPDIADSLRQNASKSVSHDHAMHTILSLGRISTAAKKDDLDLTRPNAVEFTPPSDPSALLEGRSGL